MGAGTVEAPLYRRLFLFDGFVLFVGRLSDTSVHAHFAIQLTLSIGEPVRLTSDSGSDAYTAALVLSNVAHQLDEPKDGVVLLYIDPTTLVGEHLTALYEGQTICRLDSVVQSELRAIAAAGLSDGFGSAEADVLRARLIEMLAPDVPGPSAVDERVRRTLEHLRGLDADDWDVARLAKDVSLSPDRLRHLFRDQVGIPIRSYKLWARLRRSALFLAMGQNLTETAHAVGFADSAHLSRAFRRMFGIAPSKLLASSHIEQVDEA